MKGRNFASWSIAAWPTTLKDGGAGGRLWHAKSFGQRKIDSAELLQWLRFYLRNFFRRLSGNSPQSFEMSTPSITHVSEKSINRALALRPGSTPWGVLPGEYSPGVLPRSTPQEYSPGALPRSTPQENSPRVLPASTPQEYSRVAFHLPQTGMP